MNIPTSIKISVAKKMYQTIRLLHLYPGNDPKKVTCNRDGIQWNLDLSEGIDLAIFTFGKFETTTSNLFKKIVKPGMTVFDIGANIGAHTLPLAKLVGSEGKVFAFEPTDWAIKKLNRNLSLNPDLLKQVETIQAFVGSSSNIRPIEQVYASWNLEDENTDPIHGGKAFQIKEVPTLTIDEFVESRQIKKIDLFKVDVDGFEVEVMKGAQKCFEKYRPQVVIELCPHIFERYNYKMDQLIEFFKDNQYSFLNLDMTKKYPMSEELYKFIPHNGSINALAVPS